MLWTDLNMLWLIPLRTMAAYQNNNSNAITASTTNIFFNFFYILFIFFKSDWKAQLQ